MTTFSLFHMLPIRGRSYLWQVLAPFGMCEATSALASLSAVVNLHTLSPYDERWTNAHSADKFCLSTGTFQSELHKLIYACRLTRAFIDNACSMVLKKSLTIMEVYPFSVIRCLLYHAITKIYILTLFPCKIHLSFCSMDMLSLTWKNLTHITLMIFFFHDI